MRACARSWSVFDGRGGSQADPGPPLACGLGAFGQGRTTCDPRDQTDRQAATSEHFTRSAGIALEASVIGARR